jgi:hypothetical protein
MRQLFYSLILCWLVLPAVAVAQKQSSVWMFGSNAGIDFSSGAPVRINSVMDQNEGSSVICDPTTGRLLFYTDGSTVFDRNLQMMPNGGGLVSNTSATQAAVIIPKPKSTTEYYVFTVDAGPYKGTPSRGLYYSIVDMSLNGGLGQVTVKNVRLLGQAQSTEKLLAIQHCNGRDYWVIAHAWGNNQFLAYKIDRYGVSAPVISAVGTPNSNFDQNYIGWLQSSPDGTKLAAGIYGEAVVELFDFDNATGLLSNAMNIPVAKFVYGVCFSPNGSRLYVTAAANDGSAVGDPNALYQFNLTNWNRNPILASKQQIWSGTPTVPGAQFIEVGALQLAPDGKIYMARISNPWLGVINNPNALGAACNFQVNGFSLAPNLSLQGLPTVIATYYDPTATDCRPPLADFTRSDTVICQNECITFTDKTIDNPTQWEWSFPGGATPSYNGKTPPTICFPNSGVFDIRLIASNENGSDTMIKKVTVIELPGANAGPDVAICTGGSWQLSASGNGTFSWKASASPSGLSATNIPNPVARPTKTTIYTVTVTNQYGCVSVDSVTVTVNPLPTPSTSPDTTICLGSSTIISASGGVGYQWSPAAGLSAANVPDPVASPTATTMYRVTITNEYGCTAVDSVRVRVVSAPTADAGRDTTICLEQTTTLTASGNGSYLWSPAIGLSCTTCKNPTAAPPVTTTYHLTVTNNNGCTAFDSVTVHVNQAPRRVRAYIDRNYAAYPGTMIKVPVVLEDNLDSAYISSFLFTVNYEPAMLRLGNGAPVDLPLLIGGTLVNGWSVNVITDKDGLFKARFTAPAGKYLRSNGVLMNLRFLTFLGANPISLLPFTIELDSARCTELVLSPGRVQLDSVCGINSRLMTVNADGYALKQNAPNPFNRNTTITFSLGLDGPTRLELFNASGQKMATLLNEYLGAGFHQVQWDATNYPSGIYIYRLTSGAWSDEKRMVIQ